MIVHGVARLAIATWRTSTMTMPHMIAIAADTKIAKIFVT